MQDSLLHHSFTILWAKLLLQLSPLTWLQTNKELYPASNKVISHLTAVSEELVDVPLYFSLHDVCKTVKCTPPKADVLRSALINAGGPSLVLIVFFLD